MKQFDLGINEEVLNAVAKSVSDGIGVDFIHNKKQLNTYTHNSTHSMIWDLINTNCKKNLGEGFICCVQKKKRGIWEFLIIYDKQRKKLITVMRESRLRQIIKHPQKYKKHYVAALSQFLNEGLKPNQTKLFNLPRTSEEQDYLNELSKELCSDIVEEIVQDSLYAILSFNSSSGLMTSFKATYLTQNIEMSKEIPLETYIPKDYDVIAEPVPQNGIKDIPLMLKPAALKKKQAKEEAPIDLIEVKLPNITEEIENSEE